MLYTCCRVDDDLVCGSSRSSASGLVEGFGAEEDHTHTSRRHRPSRHGLHDVSEAVTHGEGPGPGPGPRKLNTGAPNNRKSSFYCCKRKQAAVEEWRAVGMCEILLQHAPKQSELCIG